MRFRLREPLIQRCDLGKIPHCVMVNGEIRRLHSLRNCRALGVVVHSRVYALWGRSPRLAAWRDSRVLQQLFRLAGVLGTWIRIEERLKRKVRNRKAVLFHGRHRGLSVLGIFSANEDACSRFRPVQANYSCQSLPALVCRVVKVPLRW
jgi:hypothetical protein